MSKDIQDIVQIANSLSNDDLANLITMLGDRLDVYVGQLGRNQISSPVKDACMNGSVVQINLELSELERDSSKHPLGSRGGAVMNKPNLFLSREQSVEMTEKLTLILIEMYGLDGSLDTEVDQHGNESFTEDSQERFDTFYAEAEQILFALGLTEEVQS